MNSRSACAALLTAIGIASAVQAQEPTGPDTTIIDTSRVRELPELKVTVTRAEEPLQKVPYAVGILNRQDILRGQRLRRKKSGPTGRSEGPLCSPVAGRFTAA